MPAFRGLIGALFVGLRQALMKPVILLATRQGRDHRQIVDVGSAVTLSHPRLKHNSFYCLWTSVYNNPSCSAAGEKCRGCHEQVRELLPLTGQFTVPLTTKITNSYSLVDEGCKVLQREEDCNKLLHLKQELSYHNRLLCLHKRQEFNILF